MILFSLMIPTNSRGNNPRNRRSIDIDEKLFQEIGEGNMEAFEELYLISERTLYAYVLSLVKNHEDALDIMQDTYLKIRAAAHLYKPMGKPLAWIFTIARNITRNKQNANKRIVESDTLRLENRLDFSYVSEPVDKIVLESALSILSEEERSIVLLHAVSGLKHREIASNLGIPLSTSLSKYTRALKKLRKHLKEQEVGL